MSSQPPIISSSRWGARTKRNVVIACSVVLGFVLLNLSSLYPLLIVSTLLAYLLYPVTDFIEDHILARILPFRARALAVVLTFLVVIAVFVLFVLIVAPVFINQIVQLGEVIPDFLASLEADLEYWLSQPLQFNGDPILIDGEPVVPLERFQEITGQQDPTELTNAENFDVFALVSAFLGSIGDLTGPAFGVLGGFFNVVVNIAFLIFIMFYLLRDGEHFAGHVVNLTPDAYRGDVRRLLYELGRVWNAYLRGQLFLCFFVGTVVYFAALILGLPNAPVFGLLAGTLEFIPNVGPALALFPAFMVALFSESSTFPFLSGIPFALTVAVVWMIIQQIESFLLVPRVMGGSLNLHPVVVIVAIIAGASIAGALGVILAAPFTATLRLFGQYIYGKLFDIDPFPTPRRVEAPEPKRLLRWFRLARLKGSVILRGVRERVIT